MVNCPRGVLMVSEVVSSDAFSRNGTTYLTPSIERNSSPTVSFMKTSSCSGPGPKPDLLKGIPEGALEKTPRPDEAEHSISVDVLLISSCMLLIVLLKFSVSLCVASWFARMPAGIEIMIAIEKPKAMTTKNVLIFLREIFLTALVKAPNLIRHESSEQRTIKPFFRILPYSVFDPTYTNRWIS